MLNPGNDAQLMARVLEGVGFKVTKLIDATRDQMLREMLAFGRSLQQPNTVGLFYYAGHGIQVNGLNYLVPVEADVNSENEVRLQTVALGEFLQTLDAVGPHAGRVNLVILDACRNNPFARGWRSAGRGLAQVDSPAGTLISYATSPGDVAFDGSDGNSPYTKGLAQAIQSPGLTVEQTFKATRTYVQAATAREGRAQITWESTSLTGDFYFTPAKPGVAAAETQRPQQPKVEPPRVKEAAVAPTTQSIAPKAPKKDAQGCIRLGRELTGPLPVQKGTTLCSEGSADRAQIRDVTETTLTYSVNGGYGIPCRQTELCAFDWASGTLMFNVRIRPDGVPSAELVAPNR